MAVPWVASGNRTPLLTDLGSVATIHGEGRSSNHIAGLGASECSSRWIPTERSGVRTNARHGPDSQSPQHTNIRYKETQSLSKPLYCQSFTHLFTTWSILVQDYLQAYPGLVGCFWPLFRIWTLVQIKDSELLKPQAPSISDFQKQITL